MSIPSGTTPVFRDPREAGDTLPVDWLRLKQLQTREPACCCTARPVVVAVLPSTGASADPVELLMCGHHARVSWPALKEAGAFVFDATGRLLMPREPFPEPSADPGYWPNPT